MSGTSDVFPSGDTLVTFDGLGAGTPGVFSCRAGRDTDRIFITELEFNACNASLAEIAANDGVECELLCPDGTVPPCD